MTIAEQKRQLVANELTQAALMLLADKGYDTVTIDDIVTAAGVSRRTYFRYFASRRTLSSSSWRTRAPASSRHWRPVRSPNHPRSRCGTPCGSRSPPVRTIPTGRSW
ncbi:helix-turn-helix domain-containing protein [Micromonospora sp. M12]